MHHKNNLYFGLLLAALLVAGCKLGSVTGKTPETTPSTSTATKEFAIRSFKEKSKELADFSAAPHLDPKAKIKGKIALVTRSSTGYDSMETFNDESTDYDQKALDDYGFVKDEVALKAEEIDTLVQIISKKGKQIGEYTTTDGRRIPAFALESEVSVIDYKTPAIIARKMFISNQLDKNIKVDSSTEERRAFFPSAEIGKYLKSLRGK